MPFILVDFGREKKGKTYNIKIKANMSINRETNIRKIIKIIFLTVK